MYTGKTLVLPVMAMVIVGLVIAIWLHLGFIDRLTGNNNVSSRNSELLVYVPPVLQPIAYNVSRVFEQKYNVKVSIQPGPVGQLITRIELTREGDVLITPDHVFMLKAVEKDLVFYDSIKSISYVVPALIIRKGYDAQITSIEDLASIKANIRIPDPNITAYGRIAIEILKNTNLYSAVKDRLLIGGDVATVASQVRTGAVDVAILPYVVKYWYPDDVDIVWLKPQEIGPSVSCQLAAVVKYTRNRDLAEKFIQELRNYLREKFNETHFYAYQKELLSSISPYDYSSLQWPSVCKE